MTKNSITHEGKVYYSVSAAARLMGTTTARLKKIAVAEGLDWGNVRLNGRQWVGADSIAAYMDRNRPEPVRAEETSVDVDAVKQPTVFTEEGLQTIVARYDRPVLIRSGAYVDAGVDPLWPRFYRSALNQMDGGDATTSRYAIWANTVRDNIIEGMNLARRGKLDEAQQHLIRAANSLSAFADVQAHFDPFLLHAGLQP